MAKEFIDEMIDALNELRLSEAQRVYDAVKNRECPPMTMKPSVIMRTVYEVAKKHQITGDEMQGMMIFQNLTGAQMELVHDTAEKLAKKTTEE